MKKQQQQTKKSVFLVYGNDPQKRKAEIDKLTGNQAHKFDVSEVEKTGKVVANAKNDTFFTSINDIEPLANLISGNIHYSWDEYQTELYFKDANGKEIKVESPKLVIEHASLSPNDINYFGKMPYVEILGCFMSKKPV